MDNKMMDLAQIKKIVNTSHEKYIEAIVKFANKEINKIDFNKECQNFKLAKKDSYYFFCELTVNT